LRKRLDRLSRNPRVFIIGLIVFLAANALFSAWDGAQSGDGRDTSAGLLDGARPVLSADVQIVGNTAGLNGSIVFIEQRAQPNYRIAQLDFATGQVRTVLRLPSGALAYQLSKTDDPARLLVTYSPPASDAAYDRNGIYALNTQTGELSPLVASDRAGVFYAYPRQVANRLIYAVLDRDTQTRTIDMLALDTRTTIQIAEDATQPTISPDGATLVYLHIDPTTQARSIWRKRIDGEGAAVQLVAATAFPDVDLPMFAADGQQVYFVAFDDPNTPPKRTAALWSGVRRAAAHGDHNGCARRSCADAHPVRRCDRSGCAVHR
jgi:hypothetical protein